MYQEGARLFAAGFLMLLFYSFLGWCGEMLYCSAAQGRLCEKRGFLNGPLCPIYGHGAMLVLFALDGGCESPVLTFLLGGVLTGALEYVTSFLMEKLFHMRWWDYSKRRFALNGRVCLLNCVLFGLACVLLCHAVHPAVRALTEALFARAPTAATVAAAVLLAAYLADVAISVRSALRIGSRLEKLHVLRDELNGKLERLRAESRQAAEEALGVRRGRLEERMDALRAEFRQKARELCERPDWFERRLLRSFPALRSPRHGEILEKLRAYWEDRKK